MAKEQGEHARARHGFIGNAGEKCMTVAKDAVAGQDHREIAVDKNQCPIYLNCKA
jgi:hypothetical protein